MDPRIIQLQHEKMLPNVVNRNKPSQTNAKPFQAYLNEAKTSLTISKHAEKRLSERNIQINENQWAAIGGKVEEAKQKGVTDSVVILNDALLVVSAKNNTVITAMGRNEAKDHIFTNINGTILLND